MAELGYALSSEEHRPNDLVRYAQQAEEAGFTFALISDHFHPWIDQQGQSPFVWSVLGAIAHATQKLRVGTGVTCPTMRIHPTIIAQATATVASMMPGRFFLGAGTGENLNEHIQGEKWPPVAIRQEMLDEAIGIIRELWRGCNVSYEGDFYDVENARIYTVPDEPPDIYVAASGPDSAELAGEIGDGFIGTSPEAETVQAFTKSGGEGKPRLGQITVCWAKDEQEAQQTAYQWWPTAGLKGPLSQELALPAHFEQAAKMVRAEDIGKEIVCGPDPAKHLKGIASYLDAGYTGVYVHQVGPDQAGFFDFYRREIVPAFNKQYQ